MLAGAGLTVAVLTGVGRQSSGELVGQSECAGPTRLVRAGAGLCRRDRRTPRTQRVEMSDQSCRRLNGAMPTGDAAADSREQTIDGGRGLELGRGSPGPSGVLHRQSITNQATDVVRDTEELR